MADDEMVVLAAELVMTEGRASTSMLQTKLKLGFARASRVMDELEHYGIIGPQDPRNPASPRLIYGPDNWLRPMDDVDDRATEGRPSRGRSARRGTYDSSPDGVRTGRRAADAADAPTRDDDDDTRPPRRRGADARAAAPAGERPRR